jgi:hypothetical protein
MRSFIYIWCDYENDFRKAGLKIIKNERGICDTE